MENGEYKTIFIHHSPLPLHMKLPREFYTRADTLRIARELLGKTLVVPDEFGNRIAGKIVETEAYLGVEDKAAHSYNNRRTPRTETMFAAGGTAYVTLIYGMYFQFNAVVGIVGVPHACLIRAVEPLEGIETIKTRRGSMKETNLTSGPGKICIAFGIEKSFNNADLLGEQIWIEDAPPIAGDEIVSGARIGIDYAEEYAAKPWRFWIKNNRFVSRK